MPLSLDEAVEKLGSGLMHSTAGLLNAGCSCILADYTVDCLALCEWSCYIACVSQSL